MICLKIRTFVVSATTRWLICPNGTRVVICLKIRTFVVSATTEAIYKRNIIALWFAWKFVPLWYQQQPAFAPSCERKRCDLLENSYLCGISNNTPLRTSWRKSVVICLKIRTFVVSATTRYHPIECRLRCDLLENSYLCGISNNCLIWIAIWSGLWFAWKFVPLWYQQQLYATLYCKIIGCDLLENSYLCGISNNILSRYESIESVVICLKIRTFVVSATTSLLWE